jgi:outer membrane protein OmpA-like peptidoglycan-associated protein
VSYDQKLRIRNGIESASNTKNQASFSIVLHGYSSPEGEEQANYQLSQRRAEAVATWIRQVYPNIPITVVAHGEEGLGQRQVNGWVLTA